MHSIFGLLVGAALAGLLAALVTGLGALGSLEQHSGLAAHRALGLGGSILVLLTHSVVLVYLIGTGRAIKDATNDYQLDAGFYALHRAIKWRAAPWATLNTFVIVAAAVLGGVVETGGAAAWLHPLAALLALLLNAVGLPSIWRAIRDNGVLLDQVVAASWEKNRPVLESGGDPKPQASLLTPAGWALLLALSAWLPWLYLRFVMGRGSVPPWPFAALSAVLLALFAVAALRRADR
ncbi:MAG: hypothetical protein EYC70_05835 [Planctomycetota bacterium]|nr:MAG: hypothetical protein EYC70_05835 [Planctomycetota bacterium]